MRRFVSMLILAVAFVAHAVGAEPQQGPPVIRPMPTAQEYVFPSGSGVLLFHVRPDKTEDFEAVTTRLARVLDSSTDVKRKAQAASWRIFRSVESTGVTVIYLFLFDPAVQGADYDPVKILSEAVPMEVQALYERLRTDVVRVERMGLTKLR